MQHVSSAIIKEIEIVSAIWFYEKVAFLKYLTKMRYAQLVIGPAGAGKVNNFHDETVS